MSGNKKFDFTRHQLPRANKWYLFKLVFYIIVLSVLLWFIFHNGKKSTRPILNEEDLTEISIKPTF